MVKHPGTTEINAVSVCTQKRWASDMSELVDDKREGQEWACQASETLPPPEYR